MDGIDFSKMAQRAVLAERFFTNAAHMALHAFCTVAVMVLYPLVSVWFYGSAALSDIAVFGVISVVLIFLSVLYTQGATNTITWALHSVAFIQTRNYVGLLLLCAIAVVLACIAKIYQRYVNAQNTAKIRAHAYSSLHNSLKD